MGFCVIPYRQTLTEFDPLSAGRILQLKLNYPEPKEETVQLRFLPSSEARIRSRLLCGSAKGVATTDVEVSVFFCPDVDRRFSAFCLSEPDTGSTGLPSQS